MYVRKCEKKDIQAILELGKKGCHERGWVDVDWNDLHFHTTVKNIIVNQNIIVLGLFEGDLMAGFICAEISLNPWNSKPVCVIDLMHLHTTHREYYQDLLNAVYKECRRLDIKTVRTRSSSYLLDHTARETLLIRNGFAISDMCWEKQYED